MGAVKLRCSLSLMLLAGSLAAQTIPQLEANARQRLSARDANGALAAYEKLAQLNPQSAVYQDQIGFLLRRDQTNF